MVGECVRFAIPSRIHCPLIQNLNYSHSSECGFRSPVDCLENYFVKVGRFVLRAQRMSQGAGDLASSKRLSRRAFGERGAGFHVHTTAASPEHHLTLKPTNECIPTPNQCYLCIDCALRPVHSPYHLSLIPALNYRSPITQVPLDLVRYLCHLVPIYENTVPSTSQFLCFCFLSAGCCCGCYRCGAAFESADGLRWLLPRL